MCSLVSLCCKLEQKSRNYTAMSDDHLEDLHTRFILNLPTDELTKADRIFFQLEQAYWFYLDFTLEQDPSLPSYKTLQSFSRVMFTFSPLLSPLLPNFKNLWNTFAKYKRTISTFGVILLSSDCSEIALCRTWEGKVWTFPQGKVNQDEEGIVSAARETYEEVSERSERALNEDNNIIYVPLTKIILVFFTLSLPPDH